MAGLEKNSKTDLIILGAGVIGLTVAYLAATDPDVTFMIKVIARDMPEDMDSQAWASPFAGANWSPLPAAASDQRIYNWELISFNRFWDMIPTGLVKKLPSKVFSNQHRHNSELWWGKLVREFRRLDHSEIPEPYSRGAGFYTISVNSLEYIPWLKSELVACGVSFERHTVKRLAELWPLVGPKGVLVNATSLGSRCIIGVGDTKLYPVRGQTILVKSSEIHEFLAEEISAYFCKQGGEATYIIPRPGVKHTDTVLLGGTFQSGNWDTSLDMDTAQRIFERCARLAPALKDAEKTKVLSHSVGLRPAREGGPRVEAEVVEFPLNSAHGLVPQNLTNSESGNMHVVHAYGFGSGGYQMSWGAGMEVLALIKKYKKHDHVT